MNDDLDTALRGLWPWLCFVARQLAPEWLAEDVAQEGYIAAGSAYSTHQRQGDLRTWLKVCARKRMQFAALEMIRTDKRARTLMPFIDQEDTHPFVAMYRVHQALPALSPRQYDYVKCRFWEGMQTTALIEHFGCEPSSLWRGAKKKLMKEIRI